MSVFRGTEAYAMRPLPGAAVTIGNFDGVHRGHRHLLEATRAHGPAVALTFDPAPRDVLQPGHDIRRIQTLDDRVARLLQAGASAVVVERFDLELAAMEPEHFAQRVLRDRMSPQALVLGYDFRFGRRRAGTVEGLRRWLDVPVHQVEPLADAVGPISSSRVRQAVADGRMEEATALLGTPHELVGEVVHGDARGRTLGFPTANVFPRTPLVPPHGVYAVRAEIEGAWLPAVANWGRRPMWALDRPLLEVHVLDAPGLDLYDRPLRIRVEHRLRAEQRFAGPEALVAAIHDDIRRTRALLA